MSFRCLRYESFDDLASPRGLAAEPGRIAFEFDADAQEAIERARLQGLETGRAEGFEAGRQAALRDEAARLNQILPEVLAVLRQAAGEVQSVRIACERDALALVRTVLHQALPNLSEHALAREIAGFVADLIARAPAPALEVRTAATTRELLRRLLQPVPDGVRLLADQDLPEGKAVCCWASGDAWFDAKGLQEQILSILDRCADAESSPLSQKEG